MIIVASVDSPYLQSLNHRSRDVRFQNHQLATVHEKIGEVLGQTLLKYRPKRKYCFQTVQKVMAEVEDVDNRGVTILVLLRAGLFLAQGLRSVLVDEDQMFVLSSDVHDVDPQVINGRDVIIVDSVINSGDTVRRYIEICSNARSVVCISAVMQSKFQIVAGLYPGVLFITSRISDNSYVGKGSTDTGNRLFGMNQENFYENTG